MVGHAALDRRIGVRLPARQPIYPVRQHLFPVTLPGNSSLSKTGDNDVRVLALLPLTRPPVLEGHVLPGRGADFFGGNCLCGSSLETQIDH